MYSVGYRTEDSVNLDTLSSLGLEQLEKGDNPTRPLSYVLFRRQKSGPQFIDTLTLYLD